MTNDRFNAQNQNQDAANKTGMKPQQGQKEGQLGQNEKGRASESTPGSSDIR